jgi:hypothetical protein
VAQTEEPVPGQIRGWPAREGGLTEAAEVGMVPPVGVLAPAGRVLQPGGGGGAIAVEAAAAVPLHVRHHGVRYPSFFLGAQETVPSPTSYLKNLPHP